MGAVGGSDRRGSSAQAAKNLTSAVACRTLEVEHLPPRDDMPVLMPPNEAQRLEALRTASAALSAADVSAIQRRARVAASTLEAQFAAFVLVERSANRFVATHGFEAGTLPRDQFFCAHSILEDGPHVVLDAKEDPVFARMRVVQNAPGIRFYAGVPVRNDDGHVIGALCVFDSSPRTQFEDDDRNLLVELGVMTARAIRSIELGPAGWRPPRGPSPSVEEATLKRPMDTPHSSPRVALATPHPAIKHAGEEPKSTVDVSAIVEQLRAQPDLFQRIIDANPNPVTIKGDDGRFLVANAAAAALFGVSAEDLVGKRESELRERSMTGEFTRVTTDLHDTFHDDPREEQIIDAGGRPRWFEVRREPVATPRSGEYALTVSTEITADKSAQERESERRALMRLISGSDRQEAVIRRVAAFVERFVSTDAYCCAWLPRAGRLRAFHSPSVPERISSVLSAATPSPDLLTSLEDVESQVLYDGPIGDHLLATSYGDELGGDITHCVSVEIRSGSGATVGVLDLLLPGPIASDSDRQTVLSAAELIALAVEARKRAASSVYQAQYDHLTRLPNRYEMEARLGKSLAHARRSAHQVGVLILDIDQFKKFNDTLGLAVGDALLQEIAARLESCLRETDSLARMGNDEFAALLPELADSTGATRVAQKLMRSLARPFEIAGRSLVVTASVGIAVSPGDGDDPSTLLRNADSALTRAKAGGRNSFRFFAAGMHESALERLEMETALREVVSSSGLEMHLQQQLDLATGRPVGFEALARWNHPTLGPISPSKFIPIAEETRLICDIGAWMLEEACRAIQEWRERELPRISIGVNVSPVQLAAEGFVDLVARCVADFDIQPGELELEITETAMIDEIDGVVDCLRSLRSLGVRVSIDDFGTGYSALARIQRLPIDRVKIDKSFVAELEEGPGDGQGARLVEAIVRMAGSFDLDVVAEGVETAEQAAILSAIGCDVAQGYLYHQPCEARLAMDTAADRIVS